MHRARAFPEIRTPACVALAGLIVVAAAGWSERGHARSGSGLVAERVAPGVVSTGRELSQAISPDGRLLVFARRDGEHFDLMIAERRGDGWSPPEPAPFDSDFTDADPFFSADGSRLYFLSTRPAPGESGERDLPDVWVTGPTADGWRTPRNDLAVNGPDTGEGFMSLTRDGDMVFASDRGRPNARHDLHIARWDGAAFGPARPMDIEIRTEGYSNPLIGPDGDFLIFESELYPGAESDDLFIAFRTGDGWSRPVNLGPAVNSRLAEGAPNLSPDGSLLYFARMKRRPDGTLTSNLFRVPFAPVLERARRKADWSR